jgi:inosine-uridine nucleoside N-ribohydrolase
LLKRAGVDAPVLPGAMASVRGAMLAGEPGSYNRLAPKLEVPLSREDGARIARIAEAMARIEPGFHLVTIGAMTNAARLVQQRPKLAEAWSSVTCMAGRLGADAEWNVSRDPLAAQIVCRRLAPTLVGLEACSDTLPRAEVEALADKSDPASAFLLECYAAYRGQEDRPLTLFDPIALLSLVKPQAYDLQRVRVAIDDEGRMRPADGGFEITYARKSDWGAIKPVIEELLRMPHRGGPPRLSPSRVHPD